MGPDIFYSICFLVGAYLCGAVPVGFIVSRAFGAPSPFESGSGNGGAANVVRTAGWMAGVITFFGDVLKGFLPVIFWRQFGMWVPLWLLVLFLLIGSFYSPFVGFKGGKGVAVTVGAMSGISGWFFPVFLFSAAVPAFVVRISSVASLCGLAVGIVFLYMVLGWNAGFAPLVAGALVLWRHRENILRLMQGRERKF